MKILALGLIALAAIVVARRRHPKAPAAEEYLDQQRRIRVEKLLQGVPLDYEDTAARRAEGFD